MTTDRRTHISIHSGDRVGTMALNTYRHMEARTNISNTSHILYRNVSIQFRPTSPSNKHNHDLSTTHHPQPLPDILRRLRLGRRPPHAEPAPISRHARLDCGARRGQGTMIVDVCFGFDFWGVYWLVWFDLICTCIRMCVSCDWQFRYCIVRQSFYCKHQPTYPHTHPSFKPRSSSSTRPSGRS